MRQKIKRLLTWFRLGDEGQHGQVIVIVMLVIVALLVVMGLGLDLGLFYIERVRITRAVDAAALASAAELPLEAAAHARALEFLLENDYDPFAPTTRMVINLFTSPW